MRMRRKRGIKICQAMSILIKADYVIQLTLMQIKVAQVSRPPYMTLLSGGLWLLNFMTAARSSADVGGPVEAGVGIRVALAPLNRWIPFNFYFRSTPAPIESRHN